MTKSSEKNPAIEVNPEIMPASQTFYFLAVKLDGKIFIESPICHSKEMAEKHIRKNKDIQATKIVKVEIPIDL